MKGDLWNRWRQPRELPPCPACRASYGNCLHTRERMKQNGRILDRVFALQALDEKRRRLRAEGAE